MYAACCMLYAVCCMLYAVCCMLYAVCCMLYAVCCMLYAVCCMLYAVYTHDTRRYLFLDKLFVCLRSLQKVKTCTSCWAPPTRTCGCTGWTRAMMPTSNKPRIATSSAWTLCALSSLRQQRVLVLPVRMGVQSTRQLLQMVWRQRHRCNSCVVSIKTSWSMH